MAMSKEHKAALAQGRREARTIKAYLESLASRKPGRPVTVDTLKQRLARLNDQVAAEQDPLKRVDLTQKKLEVENALAKASNAADAAELEEGFVATAASYSERKGISYAAWREAGVPAAVLRRAGLTRGS
ncbi:MAG: hypothetical protein PVI35_05405 [Acidimicrobiia bacterium]|jgi:hypothetical protein